MAWIATAKRVLFVVCCAFLLALFGVMFMPKQPVRPTQATVVAIYPEPNSRRFLPSVVVVARSADGRTAEVSVPASQLRCRIGQRIRASATGVGLQLQKADCAPLTFGY